MLRFSWRITVTSRYTKTQRMNSNCWMIIFTTGSSLACAARHMTLLTVTPKFRHGPAPPCTCCGAER